MARYKTHNVFNLVLVFPLFYFSLLYFLQPADHHLLSFSGSFFFTTLFLTPDLDMAHKIKLFSIRGFFSLPFRLYSRVFKHRGVSHIFVVGTLTRLIWLFAFFLIGVYLYSGSINWDSIRLFFDKHDMYIYYSLLGVALADGSHIFLDMVTSKR